MAKARGFIAAEVPIQHLIPSWKSNRTETRRIGDLHFSTFPMIPLKLPSTVADTEFNLLFTREFAQAFAMIVDQQPLSCDERLWSG